MLLRQPNLYETAKGILLPPAKAVCGSLELGLAPRPSDDTLRLYTSDTEKLAEKHQCLTGAHKAKQRLNKNPLLGILSALGVSDPPKHT